MKNYLQTAWDLNSEKLIEVLDEVPFWSAPFGLKLLDGINYKKGIHALDIGCGTGFPLTEIAMRLGNNAKIYGIDPWDVAGNRAKKKIAIYGIKNTNIIWGVAENIPLDDNSIDLIVSNNGLNNVKDLDQSLSECARIMKSGGQFIQTVNLKESMIEFYTAMEKVLSEQGLDQSVQAMQGHIESKRKPLDQYLEQIQSQGFTIKSVDHHNFEYKFVDGTTMLNHYFIQLAFLESWKELVPIEKQAEIFELIEEELNRIGQSEGYIKLSVPFVVIDCVGR